MIAMRSNGRLLQTYEKLGVRSSYEEMPGLVVLVLL
jgi:nitrate reductase assembly molybdenum cofactor insertion protein NarJ